MKDKKSAKKPPPKDQFVALRFEMMKAPAWRAMSTSARIYYLALKSLWWEKPNNNGEIFLSQRDAAEAMGVARSTIQKCHQELIHYGFVVETLPAYLGSDGRGRAPHLRLTELPTSDGPATKDYLDWDGTLFEPPSRPDRDLPKKQKPGLDSSPPWTGNRAIRMD
jgi:hypothetical protein